MSPYGGGAASLHSARPSVRLSQPSFPDFYFSSCFDLESLNFVREFANLSFVRVD